jgi:uncharacterized protein YdiU (UPF0061 family)
MNKKFILTLSAIVIVVAAVFMAYRGYQFGQWLRTNKLF